MQKFSLLLILSTPNANLTGVNVAFVRIMVWRQRVTSHCVNKCWFILLTHICVYHAQWGNTQWFISDVLRSLPCLLVISLPGISACLNRLVLCNRPIRHLRHAVVISAFVYNLFQAILKERIHFGFIYIDFVNGLFRVMILLIKFPHGRPGEWWSYHTAVCFTARVELDFTYHALI